MHRSGVTSRWRAGETAITAIMRICAWVAPLSLLGMFLVLVGESWPFLQTVKPMAFLLGRVWEPPVLGALPLFAGSLLVVGGALVLTLPVGLAAAIYLAEMAPPGLSKQLRVVLEQLGAIPTVVLGAAGRLMLAPLLAESLGLRTDRPVALVAILVLAVAVLPTFVILAEEALAAVPGSLRAAGAALGATRWETVRHAVLPSARPGLIAAAALTFGRALGESMIVAMTAGNFPHLPRGLLSPVQPVPATIVREMGEAEGLHLPALFSLGLVLMLFSLGANVLAGQVARRGPS